MSVIDYFFLKRYIIKEIFTSDGTLGESTIPLRYKLDHSKKVIDVNLIDLLNNAQWHTYLRLSTLFNATGFEIYLEEVRGDKPQENRSPKLMKWRNIVPKTNHINSLDI